MIAVAWYAGSKFSWVNKQQETSVNVVLEKIEKVFKLVTVEGHLSEIYDFKEHNFGMELPIFRKKLLARVNAKVSVGFDFEKVKITTDDISKTITIENFPEAEILSLEHELDYYDISQSTFNKFSSADYNKINREAVDLIRFKAIDSKLIKSADEQKEEIMEMLKIIIQATGWDVIVKKKENTFID